jgi:hypothetical protein
MYHSCIAERLKLIKLEDFEETSYEIFPKQGNTSRDAGCWMIMRKESISELLDFLGRVVPRCPRRIDARKGQ